MTDIADLIDNAIWDCEQFPDAMRWTPDAPRARSPIRESVTDLLEQVRRRVPVVDSPRAGCRLMPFIGGPADGDMRAIPDDGRRTWNVPVPTPLSIFLDDTDPWNEFRYVTYSTCNLRLTLAPNEFFGLYRHWEGAARVLVAGPLPGQATLHATLIAALYAGWKPWEYE